MGEAGLQRESDGLRIWFLADILPHKCRFSCVVVHSCPSPSSGDTSLAAPSTKCVNGAALQTISFARVSLTSQLATNQLARKCNSTGHSGPRDFTSSTTTISQSKYNHTLNQLAQLQKPVGAQPLSDVTLSSQKARHTLPGPFGRKNCSNIFSELDGLITPRKVHGTGKTRLKAPPSMKQADLSKEK